MMGLTADDVLRDIEFELVQGTISKDELGQSIQLVKKYQNKLRGELFETDSLSQDNRDIVTRQFQINEMLTTLLQEMAAKIQRIRLELHQTKDLSQRLSLAKGENSDPTSDAVRLDSTHSTPTDLNLPKITSPVIPFELDQDAWQPSIEIEEAMKDEALDVLMDVRSSGIPIIGRMTKRVRIALHNLTLFYVGRLAMKQAPINRTYGDCLLHLNSQNQYQQEQIINLTQQLSALQKRIKELEQ